MLDLSGALSDGLEDPIEAVKQKKCFIYEVAFRKEMTSSWGTTLSSAKKHLKIQYANQMRLTETKLIISHVYTAHTQWKA